MAASKRFSGPELMRILFETKQGADIEEYPGCQGGEPLTATAAARSALPDALPARLSFWTSRAVLNALNGKVEGLGLDGDRVWVRANGRLLAYDLRSNTWYPVHFPAYLIGLLGLAEALLQPEQAGALLSAYNALQLEMEDAGREDSPGLRQLLHRTADELGYWLAFGGRPQNRLEGGRLITGEDLLDIDLSTARPLAGCLTDSRQLSRYLLGEEPDCAEYDPTQETEQAAEQASYEELLLAGLDLSEAVFQGRSVLAELADAVRSARPALLWGRPAWARPRPCTTSCAA